jgi:probable phosphomutase (TIGR03848 family)
MPRRPTSTPGRTLRSRLPSGDHARGRRPAPTTVVLVRHGQTPTTGRVMPGRAAGLHLAEAGVAQARATAERIAATWKVSAVYSSPLERARETAAEIARRLGLRVRLRRGLLECDTGDWTGAELKELARLPDWRTVQRWPSGFRFPNGESFLEMAARVTSTVTDLARQHPGQTIVVVSHADPIKAAVADALGTHLDHFQRLVISTCSMSVVAYGPQGPAVLAVNSLPDSLETKPS